MRFATWNVNSLKVRQQQVLDWLAANPDLTALALQETKMEDSVFPQAEIEAAGYHVAFIGQKTYNGVAIISRQPLTDIQYNLPNFDDPQKRVIAATVAGVRFICAYIPNGQSLDSDKYPYKLAWLEAMNAYLIDEIARHPKLILAGDYNIAPEDRDVHDITKWAGGVLVSPAERAAFAGMIALGLTDAFRNFEQAEKSFSWWDYRGFSFKKNAGLRIDHLLITPDLTRKLTASGIDIEPRKHERPSDHTPVWASFTD
ncbi:Exodeoxyribonuclease III [Andreprevotia sp. IGB-42]|uniref:exodeoxyribonuclease III n=1 Tax=Andreprevotia sp. IGB-42 TaxID=2497473 RepID=UPI00135B4265|nr:exodeoxyribonuclease III [Andreprevotia sp. IGB-42]KAF0811839.1 Exodeoxyribonuclease III [Andreprevotia sp. IGB-42]